MELHMQQGKSEDQKRHESLSAKLTRYTGLTRAIEFFSQKLNSEQILDAAFDFTNELLSLEKCAIFILQGKSFILKKIKGYDQGLSSLANGENLQNLAVFHGTLAYRQEQMNRFFEKSFLKAYEPSVIIPLIVENGLYGFIVVSMETALHNESDELIISEALMRLINNAFENNKRYEDLQKANKDLDEKIFSLFAINQSSKALLSELSLDILYNLSVDVFSEITQSSVTGFLLYDEKSEKYTLKAFKDVYYSMPDMFINLSFNKTARVDLNKVIIDVSVETDVMYFNSLFQESIKEIEALKALYLVLLIKNGKILGFVTLGRTTTGFEYKKSMFELIDSLASATYIAISNAQLLKQVNDQKRLIQNKLEKLISLNNLTRNINSSSKLETLIGLTLKTLDISFDVEKAMIALYDKETKSFNIADTLNIQTDKKIIKPNSQWKKFFEGDTVYEATENGVSKYIGKNLLKDIESSSGIVMVPIYIDRVDIEMLGAMILFKYRNTPINDEEYLLTMETIAGHIAPVLSNLFTIEEQLKFLLPNYIELFKRDLREEISEAIDFSLDLAVLQVTDNRSFVFKGNAIVDKIRENYKKVYPFSNSNIFIILNDIDENIDKNIKDITGVEDIKIRSMVLGRDFSDFQGFFKQF